MVFLVVISKFDSSTNPGLWVFWDEGSGLLKICRDRGPFKICCRKEQRMFPPCKQYAPKKKEQNYANPKFFFSNSLIK